MTLLPVRRIFLPLACHGAETQSAEHAAAKAAGALAHRFGASITAFLPLIDPRLSVAYVGEAATGTVIDNLLEAGETENKARRAYAAKLVEQELAAAPCALVEAAGREDDVIASHARVHDLSVLSRGPADRWTDTGFLSLVEALVLDGGRPLLLAPASATTDIGQPPKSVLIAWTDTPEAARALSHALVFLGPETKVTLLAVGPHDLTGPAQLLEAHGFASARVHMDRPDGGWLDDPTGDAILKAGQDCKADLIVLGAFVHSRLRQMLIGGPTRTLLRDSRTPLLLAH